MKKLEFRKFDEDLFAWFFMGDKFKLNRIGKPAVILSNGKFEYWIDGKRIL